MSEPAQRSDRGLLRGGRMSLTAFEAQWLYLVISTCTDIAADTLEDVDAELLPRKPIECPYEAWDVIVDKLIPITPDVELYRSIEGKYRTRKSQDQARA